MKHQLGVLWKTVCYGEWW